MPFWLGKPAFKSSFSSAKAGSYGISHCDHSEPSGVPRVGRDSAGESPVRRPFQAAIMLALTAGVAVLIASGLYIWHREVTLGIRR
jgi:hypothetical protein